MSINQLHGIYHSLVLPVIEQARPISHVVLCLRHAGAEAANVLAPDLLLRLLPPERLLQLELAPRGSGRGLALLAAALARVGHLQEATWMQMELKWESWIRKTKPKALITFPLYPRAFRTKAIMKLCYNSIACILHLRM